MEKNYYEIAQKIQDEIKVVVLGKDEVINKILASTLAGGHVLLDDIPGVGKTTLALAFSKATSMDGEYGNNTVSAVKLFQSAAGLSATGTADITTINTLYKQKAPTLPSGLKAADAAMS